MGRSIGEISWNDDDGASLGESLLYATLCIVGLPVDVHVKNGSVYSGIFHTASVKGVILKKARMTKKGRSNSNVASGSIIETLVILAEDLVQVIAKGVELPAEGVIGTIAGNESELAIGTASHDVARANNWLDTFATSKMKPHQRKTSVPSENGSTNGDTCPCFKVSSPRPAENESEGKSVSIEVVNNVSEEGIEKRGRKIDIMGGGALDALPNERQVDENPLVKQHDFNRESENQRDDKASAMQGSSPSLDACLSQVKFVDGTHSELLPPLQPNEASHVIVSAPARSNNETYSRPVSSENATSRCGLASAPSIVGTSSSSISSVASQTEKVHLQGPESNKRAKESKLNPGAKIFSPAFTNPVPATSHLAQKVTGMSYVPSASPLLLAAAAQAEVGTSTYVPQPSVTAKAVQYNNYTAGNSDVAAISQGLAGSMGNRTQLLRYGGQHQALPLGSTFVHPSSQAVMVGRLVYMPVSQDLVQSGTAISPAFPRPLPTISQVQFPKHQGTLSGQPFVHQPTVSGQQLYAAVSPPPLLQSPFLTNRPISVPGANGLFNTKFL